MVKFLIYLNRHVFLMKNLHALMQNRTEDNPMVLANGIFFLFLRQDIFYGYKSKIASLVHLNAYAE